ncbi:hypothetical protein JX85_23620 [Salmonella enterica]|nr:hypothetical protein [Salmonella enterica]
MTITVKKRIDIKQKSKLSDFYSDIGTEYMRYENQETKFRDNDPIERQKYVGGDMLCPINDCYSMPHARLEPFAYHAYITRANKEKSRIHRLVATSEGIQKLAAEYEIVIGKIEDQSEAAFKSFVANVFESISETIEFNGLDIPRGWAARKHIRIDE